MSGIRKFTRRRQALNKPKKIKTKFTILDGILILGLTLTFAGIIFGVLGYCYYTGGRPEGIRQTRGGNFYVEHEEPGHLYYRDLAKFGAVLFVIGLLISGLSNAARPSRRDGAGALENEYDVI
ncbi:MAG: hypothetical protein ACYS6K_09800 [Planctomycetota bacterium]|jgi:hypothetical protein